MRSRPYARSAIAQFPRHTEDGAPSYQYGESQCSRCIRCIVRDGRRNRNCDIRPSYSDLLILIASRARIGKPALAKEIRLFARAAEGHGRERGPRADPGAATRHFEHRSDLLGKDSLSLRASPPAGVVQFRSAANMANALQHFL